MLVSVDEILRIISYELSEILLDINGTLKAEFSALKEIHNHLTVKPKIQKDTINRKTLVTSA
jgi:hypothetical protein